MKDITIIRDFDRIPCDNYVYVHCKADTGEVFYVGKGIKHRVTVVSGRNRRWQDVAEKHGVVAKIIIGGVQEWYAFEVEQELVAYYGRESDGGSLVNLTDGGKSGGNMDKDVIERRIRKLHQWQQMEYEKYGKIRRGSNALKPAISYTFVNKDGSIFTGYRLAFKEATGIDPRYLFTTRQSHTVKGWGVCREGESAEDCLARINIGHHNLDPNRYTFVHISGITFYGTRYELMEKFNIDEIGRLLQNSSTRKSVCGWSLLED